MHDSLDEQDDMRSFIDNNEDTTTRPTHAIAIFYKSTGIFDDWQTTGSYIHCKQHMQEHGNPSNWSIIPVNKTIGFPEPQQPLISFINE